MGTRQISDLISTGDLLATQSQLHDSFNELFFSGCTLWRISMILTVTTNTI